MYPAYVGSFSCTDTALSSALRPLARWMAVSSARPDSGDSSYATRIFLNIFCLLPITRGAPQVQNRSDELDQNSYRTLTEGSTDIPRRTRCWGSVSRLKQIPTHSR